MNNVKELSYAIRTTFGAPLDVRYVLSSIDNLTTELPQALRYQGMLVYVKDIEKLYIFKGGVTNENFVPFKQADIVHEKITFVGDYEFVHNMNSASFIVNIFDSRGDAVDIPWRIGYLNKTGKTTDELTFGERNVISLSTDVKDTYALTLISA